MKTQRLKQAAEAAAQMQRDYLSGCVGQVYPVLFEQGDGERCAGHAPNYALVSVQSREALQNTVRPVAVTALEGETLLGVLKEEQ